MSLSMLLLVAILAWPSPAASQTSKWDARVFQNTNGLFVGQVLIQRLSNKTLKINVPFVGQVGNSKTIRISLWRGTCENFIEQLVPTRSKKSTFYGVFTDNYTLTKAQSQKVTGALSSDTVAIVLNDNCGVFEIPGSTGRIRTKPIPFGLSGRYNEWEMTLLSVNEDAYAALSSANSFNKAPHVGWQYVLFYVKLKYLGHDSASTAWFITEAKAVGVSGRTYQWSYGYSCGVLPEPDITALSAGIEIFPGDPIEGNLFCLEVKSSDLQSLVVYFGRDDLPYRQRTWWAIR
jgi:hypothetical protein